MPEWLHTRLSVAMSVQLPEGGQGNAKVSRSLLVQRRARFHHRPAWGVTSIHTVWEAAMTGIQGFVARENIKHLHHELEGSADPIRRATMLKLLGRGKRSLRPYGRAIGQIESAHFPPGRDHRAAGQADRRLKGPSAKRALVVALQMCS